MSDCKFWGKCFLLPINFPACFISCHLWNRAVLPLIEAWNTQLLQNKTACGLAFSHCRWSRCWGPPGLCCGVAWRGCRPPTQIYECWISCPQASSPCLALGPRRAAPAWSAAATACTHKHAETQTCWNPIKLSNLFLSFFLLNSFIKKQYETIQALSFDNYF